MRLLKLTAFLSLWVFFFALVGMVHLWVSILGLPNRWKVISRLNRNFTLLLRMILNIKVAVTGDEGQLERGGYVIIANHVSYVDGIVLGSIFPILFVSKREVRSWPIVGQWNTLCGTVFINRQHKEQVGMLGRRDQQQAEARSQYPAYFPKALRPTAKRCCPFKPCRWRRRCAIARSSCRPPSPTKPSMMRRSPPANRDLIYWYGDMDFLTHFWHLLGHRSIEVLVTIQPKIECFRYEDNSAGRKKLGRGLL